MPGYETGTGPDMLKITDPDPRRQNHMDLGLGYPAKQTCRFAKFRFETKLAVSHVSLFFNETKPSVSHVS
jgi:hypothetical protein